MKPPQVVVSFLSMALVAAWSSAADVSDDAIAGFKAAAQAQAAAAREARAAGGSPAVAPAPSAPRAPRAAKKVDLLPQFAGPSTRNQCSIGSCHAFGSVAVLEAAYFRAYKEHISIAEQDVFLQRTVLSGDAYRDFCATGKCELSEGNDVSGDIRYVLGHGALTGGSYAEFAQRYVRYRNAEQKTMEGIQKGYEKMGWLEKLFYDPRKHWKELSSSASSKRILTEFLQGRGTASSAERGELKGKLAGFRLRTKSDFGFKPEHKDLPPKDCQARGAGQRAALKGELDVSRPVSVSMSLSGLTEWGQTDQTRDAYHAFVIVGYESTPEGLRFHTRNSWGGRNPDIPETQTCRIYILDTVLAPAETATF